MIVVRNNCIITFEVFSNVVTNNYLEQLAAADEHEVVQEVQVPLIRTCSVQCH
jgi:hypothetical protein